MLGRPTSARRICLALRALSSSLFGTQTSAYCRSGCVPTQKPNWPHQTSTILFNSDFSSGDVNALINSLQYWNDYFETNGMSAPLQFVSSVQGLTVGVNVLVIIDQDLSG